MSAVLETIPDTEDGPSLAHINGSNGSLIPNALYTTVMSRSGRLNTPPVAVEPNTRSSSFNNIPLMSSSPASSLDSGSMFASSVDLTGSLENQLKYSPTFNDVLDRLGRLENTTRDIQHQLSDVDRKVKVLLERYINTNAAPEFSNPFATNPSQSFSAAPRVSIIGNIAPNQVAPADDITEISQRLNSLTSSVDQLVALSAAQKMQMGGGSFSGSQMLGPTAQMGEFNARMFPAGVANANALGHGLPGSRGDIRPTQRMPNAPMRTWSAGTLDIPQPRASESGPSLLGRPDIFRDKRRSVSALSRRDSAGVCCVRLHLMLACVESHAYTLYRASRS